jgi:hypothetical protein
MITNKGRVTHFLTRKRLLVQIWPANDSPLFGLRGYDPSFYEVIQYGELAGVAVFLWSDDASFVTAHVFTETD